jgi:hypothetical protein
VDSAELSSGVERIGSVGSAVSVPIGSFRLLRGSTEPVDAVTVSGSTTVVVEVTVSTVLGATSVWPTTAPDASERGSELVPAEGVAAVVRSVDPADVDPPVLVAVASVPAVEESVLAEESVPAVEESALAVDESVLAVEESVLAVVVGAGSSGAESVGPGSLEVGSGAGAGSGAGSEGVVDALAVVSVDSPVTCVVSEAAVVTSVTGSVAVVLASVVAVVTAAAGSEVVASVADPTEAALPLTSLMMWPPEGSSLSPG